jgi:phosphate transport system protein
MERLFDIQIDKLKTKLIKMCSLVDEQVEFAIRSIEKNNHTLADIVEDRDNRVDKYDIKIEKICQKMFALNQPVAMDLRLIMSALKINANLERIGDIAVNIALDSKELQAIPEFFPRLHFNEIAGIARSMIKMAIDSFISNDIDLAKKVISSDDKLDDLVIEDSKLIKEIMKEKTENIDPGLIFYSVFRELERLGDHATNIGEEVYFIMKAQLIKHSNEDFSENSENNDT